MNDAIKRLAFRAAGGAGQWVTTRASSRAEVAGPAEGTADLPLVRPGVERAKQQHGDRLIGTEGPAMVLLAVSSGSRSVSSLGEVVQPM